MADGEDTEGSAEGKVARVELAGLVIVVGHSVAVEA